jgi:ABC-type polysaccharide/polyol phosphate export permease
MPRVGFKTTTPVLERVKTVPALDPAATVIGTQLLPTCSNVWHASLRILTMGGRLNFTDTACILVLLVFSVTLLLLRFSPSYCLIYVNVFCSDIQNIWPYVRCMFFLLQYLSCPTVYEYVHMHKGNLLSYM